MIEGGNQVGREITGPHTEIPQNEQVRVAVPGRRLSDGASATLVLMWWPRLRAWTFYPDCDSAQGVFVPAEEVAPLVALLTTVPGGG